MQRAPNEGTSDFFDVHTGSIRRDYMRHPALAAALDALFDLRLSHDRRLRAAKRRAAAAVPQRILIVGVRVPARGEEMNRITRQLAESRHEVRVSTVTMRPKGKFENVDEAIAAAGEPLRSFDWLIVTDDDVDLPNGFTDTYLAIAGEAGLVISQPAHRFRSYATYQVTRRKFGRIARRTGFVEIGPLTVIHNKAFAALVPFPSLRWSYGLDVLWAQIAAENTWRIGVVDALPIGHVRPVAADYHMTEAREEGRAFLRRNGVTLNRAELFKDYGDAL